MKKVLLILFLLLLSGLKIYASDFHSCKIYYSDQKYHSASDCFYSVLKTKPDDVQSRFYYAASLFFDRQYNMSYAQYNYIAQKYPNSNIGKYSKQEAAKVYRKIQDIQRAKNNDTGNYAQYLEHLTKWYNMPVKVWVQPSPYSATAKKAFYEWQSKSSNLVRFTYVSTAKQAQIRIYFVDKINQPVSSQNIGLTNLKYIGNMNTSADVQILQRTDSGKMRTYAQIYPVILHEAGHALGMSGHSNSNNDILFENNYTNDTHLSNRDINTLRVIYK